MRYYNITASNPQAIIQNHYIMVFTKRDKKGALKLIEKDYKAEGYTIDELTLEEALAAVTKDNFIFRLEKNYIWPKEAKEILSKEVTRKKFDKQIGNINKFKNFFKD